MVEYYLTHLVPNVYQYANHQSLFDGAQMKNINRTADQVRVVTSSNLLYVLSPYVYRAIVDDVRSNPDTFFVERRLRQAQPVSDWGVRQCVMTGCDLIQAVLPIWQNNTSDEILAQVTAEIAEAAHESTDEAYSHLSERWELAAKNVKYYLQKRYIDEKSGRKDDSDFYVVSLVGGAFYNLVMAEPGAFARLAHYTFTAQATLTNRGVTRINGGTSNNKDRIKTITENIKQDQVARFKKYWTHN